MRIVRVALAGWVLAGLIGGCAIGCPDALLVGVLVAEGGDLVVEHPDGFVAPVDWTAAGQRVREEDGRLVLVDGMGHVKAREGDTVRLGGGDRDGTFMPCGTFQVDPAGASVPATMTAAEGWQSGRMQRS